MSWVLFFVQLKEAQFLPALLLRAFQQPRHSNFFSNSSETQRGTFDLRSSAMMICFIMMQSL